MQVKGFSMPGVIDPEDAPAEKAYDAFPLRLLVVDFDGRIAVDQGRGLPGDGDPWDFGAIERWLDGHGAR